MITKEPNKTESGRPNLYVMEIDSTTSDYLRKKWFYPVSPLCARQYEKINPDQDYEFHRVHPITKNSIKLDQWGWIRWYPKTGGAKWGPDIQPEYGWYGKNYWIVENELGADEETNIIQNYKNRLRGDYLLIMRNYPTIPEEEKEELIEFYQLKGFEIEFLDDSIILRKNGRSMTMSNIEILKLIHLFDTDKDKRQW